MSHFQITEAAALAGISTRHFQRILAKGEVPGATRTPAGRWKIPDTFEVRKWAEDFRRWSGVAVPEIRRPVIRPKRLRRVGSARDAVAALRTAQDAAQRAMGDLHGQALRMGVILLQSPAKGREWSLLLKSLGITRGEAAEFKRLARRPGGPALTHREARELGAFVGIGEVEGPAMPQPVKPIAGKSFVAHAGAIRGWFARHLPDRPLDEWSDMEVAVAAEALAPVADIAREVTAYLRSGRLVFGGVE